MLSEADLTSALEAEIQRFIAQGYRVTARTATTAQLVRPKSFNVALAILGLLFLVIGLLIYLIVYASTQDDAVYLTVRPDGTIDRRFSGGAGAGQNDPRRWDCEQCGYRNYPSRPRCKRCQTPRLIDP